MATPTNEGKSAESVDVRSVYGALVQLAIHGQENKWWMLYIFLTFNSILLLSCGALFAAQQFAAAHKILVCVLSAGGTLIDICWIVMAADYVKASNLFSDEVVAAEMLLPEQFPTPFIKRRAQRAVKSRFGTSSHRASRSGLTHRDVHCHRSSWLAEELELTRTGTSVDC